MFACVYVCVYEPLVLRVYLCFSLCVLKRESHCLFVCVCVCVDLVCLRVFVVMFVFVCF